MLSISVTPVSDVSSWTIFFATLSRLFVRLCATTHSPIESRVFHDAHHLHFSTLVYVQLPFIYFGDHFPPAKTHLSNSVIFPASVRHGRRLSLKRILLTTASRSSHISILTRATIVRKKRKKKNKREKRGSVRKAQKENYALRIWRTEERISEEIGVPSREITLNFVLTKHAALSIL